MKKLFPLLLLAAACAPKNETLVSFKNDAAFGYVETEITNRVGNDLVAGDCNIELDGKTQHFQTPARISLPVYQDQAGSDAIVTCTFGDDEKTAILKSQSPNAIQSNSIDASNTDGFRRGEVIDPIAGDAAPNNLGGWLALGLSTKAVPANVFAYPSEVTLRF